MTSPAEFAIRPMIESDLDAVQTLERETDTAPHWARADYTAAIQPQDESALRRIALVAEVDCTVAGFAVVRLVATADGTEAELESIVVASSWRERGVGTALLAELALMAKLFGSLQLDLEVRVSNEAALRLYRRAGFRETGRRKGYYRDPVEDAVSMSAIL